MRHIAPQNLPIPDLHPVVKRLPDGLVPPPAEEQELPYALEAREHGAILEVRRPLRLHRLDGVHADEALPRAAVVALEGLVDGLGPAVASDV